MGKTYNYEFRRKMSYNTGKGQRHLVKKLRVLRFKDLQTAKKV